MPVSYRHFMPVFPAALTEFFDGLSGFILNRVGDLQGAADGVHVLLGPVDSHALVDGRKKIPDADQPVGYIRAALVASAYDPSALNSSAAQDKRPALRPVIAPAVRIVVRGPAKFAHGDHDSRFEQTSLLQTGHQGGERQV